VTISTSEASHEESGDGPKTASEKRQFSLCLSNKKIWKNRQGLHQGGSVFADSAPVSNGSEDKASPGC
jgi:hypothetical protein